MQNFHLLISTIQIRINRKYQKILYANFSSFYLDRPTQIFHLLISTVLIRINRKYFLHVSRIFILFYDSLSGIYPIVRFWDEMKASQGTCTLSRPIAYPNNF